MFNLTARRSIQAALVAAIALVGSRIAAGDERPSRKSGNRTAACARLVSRRHRNAGRGAIVFDPQSAPTRQRPRKGLPRFSHHSRWASLKTTSISGRWLAERSSSPSTECGLPRVTSKFGEFYAEGCSIIVFDRDLGQAAVDWTNALRKEAKEIRKIAGREVLCFRSKEIKAWKGPGIYFAEASPDTILCATHDELLATAPRIASTSGHRHRAIDTPPRSGKPPPCFPTVFRNGRQSTGWPPSG